MGRKRRYTNAGRIPRPGEVPESPMVRWVVRYQDGSSWSTEPDREDFFRKISRISALRKPVAVVLEQIYVPEHPKAFLYQPRPDLLEELLRTFPECRGEGDDA